MRVLLLSIVIFSFTTIFFGGCTVGKNVIKETTSTIEIDTIYETDTVTKYITLPPDTVFADIEKIEANESNANKLLNDSLTIGPWFAHSERSWAVAGISNNVPYLKLVDIELTKAFDIPIDKKIPVITKTKTKTEYKEIIKHKPLFQNIWFYVSVILGVLLFFFIILTIKHNS